jgi:hypothetical protein
MVLFKVSFFGKISFENEEDRSVCAGRVRCKRRTRVFFYCFSLLEEMSMRKVTGVLMVVTLLLAFGPSANATRTWVSGNVGNWTDTANWSGGALPTTSETAQIQNGNSTLNANVTIGQLLMGYASTDVAVLNVNTGSNLTISKASAELFCLVKAGTSAGASTTVNQNSGTVRVFSGSGTGEVRLVTASTTTGTAVYNLSGTGVLDTEILSKGNKTNTAAQFNATGGTLVIRNMMYRFGLISEGAGLIRAQPHWKLALSILPQQYQSVMPPMQWITPQEQAQY